MGRLNGKVCVITGAGGGMGREAAIVFTEEGAKVCVADLDMALAEETVSLCAGNAFAVAVDVADEDGVRAMCAATAAGSDGITMAIERAFTVAAARSFAWTFAPRWTVSPVNEVNIVAPSDQMSER